MNITPEDTKQQAGGCTAIVPVPSQSRNTMWAWFIALMGWSVVVCFYDLGGGAAFEMTDCWVAQSAREMLEAGDWLVPRFSGETRLQKSPGAYWAVMLTSVLMGSDVTEFTARVPNAIGGLMIVATVFWLALRIAGERVAIYAGFVAASSVTVVYWSHRGASDLGLAALNTVSLACLWVGTSRYVQGGRGHIVLWLGGYLFAGLGMLYKMPMPLATVGVPAVLYLLIQRRWFILKSKWHLIGLLVFLLPWLPWAIAVVVSEPNAVDKWRVEFVDRFTGDLPNVEGQGSWKMLPFYLLPLFVYAIPFCLSIPAAIVRAFRRDDTADRDGVRFLLIWIIGLFAFFTASTGKELRYFLPVMPPVFVLLGMELAVLFDSRRIVREAMVRLAVRAAWIGVPLGFIAGGFGLYRWNRHQQHLFEWSTVWPPYAVFAILFGVGACISAWCFLHRLRDAAFGVLVGTMWVSWLWAWSNLLPIVANQVPSQDFAEQLRDQIPATMHDQLYSVGNQDSRIIWYSDVRMKRVIDQLELLEMQGGQRSRQNEERLIAEEMIRKLRGDELVLYVCYRPLYVQFLIEAGAALKERGEQMPRTYLWFQTRRGAPAKHYVLFANQPPAWEPPPLTPPSQRLEAALK